MAGMVRGRLGLVVLTALLAAGCQSEGGARDGGPQGGPPYPTTPVGAVGSLVGSVDESTLPREVLERTVDGAVLITTEADRDALAEALGLPSVEGVDLSRHLLVAGSYPRCAETSQVLLDTGREPPGLRFVVRRASPETVCAWSPLTIDVWAVPRTALDGTDGEPELVTRAPTG